MTAAYVPIPASFSSFSSLSSSSSSSSSSHPTVNSSVRRGGDGSVPPSSISSNSYEERPRNSLTCQTFTQLTRLADNIICKPSIPHGVSAVQTPAMACMFIGVLHATSTDPIPLYFPTWHLPWLSLMCAVNAGISSVVLRNQLSKTPGWPSKTQILGLCFMASSASLSAIHLGNYFQLRYHGVMDKHRLIGPMALETGKCLLAALEIGLTLQIAMHPSWKQHIYSKLDLPDLEDLGTDGVTRSTSEPARLRQPWVPPAGLVTTASLLNCLKYWDRRFWMDGLFYSIPAVGGCFMGMLLLWNRLAKGYINTIYKINVWDKATLLFCMSLANFAIKNAVYEALVPSFYKSPFFLNHPSYIWTELPLLLACCIGALFVGGGMAAVCIRNPEGGQPLLGRSRASTDHSPTNLPVELSSLEIT